MARKSESGKGGNFDTRPNPFAGVRATPKMAADFTEVRDLAKALQLLTEAGCAMLVGRTRDGGAVVLTILDGDTRHRTYCSDADELNDAFTSIMNMYGED